jgi:hypothetical protein
VSPGDIAEPLRALLRKQANVRVRFAEAIEIDLDRRCVQLDLGELPYDYLIVATGASHSYFGYAEWEAVAPGLKTLDDTLEIRRRILLAFECAEAESDPAVRQALITFVVMGGGPTGVELAGAIAEIARHTLAHEFRSIDPSRARILLLEGAPRVLPAYAPDLSAAAEFELRQLGVQVRTGRPGDAPHRLGQALVVPDQPAEARGSRKGTLHHPPAWQQDEAPLGLSVLDHLELDPVVLGRCRHIVTGVALVHEGHLHRFAGHLLHLAGEFLRLRPLLLRGWRDHQRERWWPTRSTSAQAVRSACSASAAVHRVSCSAEL